MTRVIAVASGKGGVGKTTMTANLGVELSKQGEDVLIIDGNFSGANVSQHFGIEFQEVTLNDVLDGDAYITEAVSKHHAGVSVVPASVLEFSSDPEKLKHTLVDFLGEKDYVFIDCAAGVGEEVEASIGAADEVLLVSEPEVPALTNCLGAKKLADEMDKEVIGLVLNGVRGETSEVSAEDAEDLVETEVVGKVPDDGHVREAIAMKEPVVSYRSNCRASHAISDVAYRVQGEEPPERGFSHQVKVALEEFSLF
ncbi:MAG: cell division ATPase MinD [Candidatus Nanohaloarchaea archaeon]